MMSIRHVERMSDQGVHPFAPCACQGDQLTPVSVVDFRGIHYVCALCSRPKNPSTVVYFNGADALAKTGWVIGPDDPLPIA